MRRSILPWAALCASVGITLGVAAFVDQTARTRDETRFHLAVQTARDSIDGRLESYSLLLRSAAAFLAADPAATAEDFHRYVDRLDLRERHVGVQGLFFVRLFHRAEADAVEADLAARGFPVRVWPDGGHEVRSAIVWLEPQEGPNRRVAGFDMMADPVRREAMERARDQGRPALSGKVALLQEEEPNPQAGFILFAPVYRGGATPEGREARREALLGWVSSAFRADDLFTGLFGREARPVLDFEVYDGNQVEPRSLLHNKPVIAAKGALREEQRLEVAGRTWTLVFASLGSLTSDSVRTLLPGVLLVGAIVSLLFFFLTRREALARRRIDETAVELTRSLAGRQLVEERLREEGRVSDTLRKLGISLAAELDETRLTQLITDEATSLTGAGFGAFFHTVQGASGEAVHLYTLSGIDRAAFAGFSVPRNTLLFGPTLRGEGVVRSGDILNDPRYEKDPPHHGMPADHPPVRSYLAVPVLSRTGGVLGGLFFGHPEPGRFTDQHERLVQGLAAQASIAMDNARLLRQLRDNDRRKDEFLAVLGHELRNPLAPIVTALEMMRRDPSSSPRQRPIIERQARHMVQLVDDLLDVSRINRGKIELKRQRISVGEALTRAVEAVAPLSRARDQLLEVTPPARPLVIEADPVRVEQILTNLLTNAIKYTPENGSVFLSAEHREGDLVFSVRDTGIGIPRDAMPSLFEPFVQVPGARDYAKGGLGIGLALVKALVELHGGAVSVSSEGPGRGSTFVVVLPGAEEGYTPLEVKKLSSAARTGKILVVDDNIDAALTLSEVLGFDGHEVRVAHDGPSAIVLAQEFLPQVVLLDIGLPGMTGYEVVGKLRALAGMDRAIVIALTGFGQESDRQRALKAGFNEHLVKPVELQVVQEVLRQHLGART